MNAKETAQTIREQLKAADVKARCRVAPGERKDCVQVISPAYNAPFSDDDQRTIRTIAVGLGLTWVRGLPINVDRMTDPDQMNFYLPGK